MAATFAAYPYSPITLPPHILYWATPNMESASSPYNATMEKMNQIKNFSFLILKSAQKIHNHSKYISKRHW